MRVDVFACPKCNSKCKSWFKWDISSTSPVTDQMGYMPAGQRVCKGCSVGPHFNLSPIPVALENVKALHLTNVITWTSAMSVAANLFPNAAKVKIDNP